MYIFEAVRAHNTDYFFAHIDATDVNTTDAFGGNLLHVAAAHGRHDIARELIRRDINLNCQNREGQTPLHFAAEYRDYEMARLILEHGGDVTIKDGFGNTPLWSAVFDSSGDHRIVGLLLDYGADPDDLNRAGRSPLHMAREFKDDKLIRLLTEPREGRSAPARASNSEPRAPTGVSRRSSEGSAQQFRYPEEAKQLWKKYVPPSGQADTVQGELIRAVEKLRHEAQRNGNGNWDQGHEIFCSFIRDTLCNSGVFSNDIASTIQLDVSRLRDYTHPYLEDDIYDRLTDYIVEWSRNYPEPIPRQPNPDLWR
jgi:hypothetical protein